MTSVTDTPRTGKREARLREENFALTCRIETLYAEIGDLHRQFAAKALGLSPYAQPREVVEALTTALPGWPAKRWTELARLIEAHAVTAGPIS
jgi:hypothetical protein